MSEIEIKKVNDFIDNQEFKALIDDFNTSRNNFEAGQVQVTLRGKQLCLSFQTSSTLDICAQSSKLSLNDESGSIYDLKTALLKFGVSEEFIEDNFNEIEKHIYKKFKVQKIYDDYMSEIGAWEPDTRGIDANSEVFNLK